MGLDGWRRWLAGILSLGAGLWLGWSPAQGNRSIPLDPSTPLFHAPRDQRSNPSEEGVRAGLDLLRFLEEGDRSALQRAEAMYQAIIPQEPVGLEYPALLWGCRLLLADEARRAIMLENPHHARFHRFI